MVTYLTQYEDSLLWYHEGDLQFILDNTHQGIDLKAETDLHHPYIPEFCVLRDLSDIIFREHLRQINKKGLHIIS